MRSSNWLLCSNTTGFWSLCAPAGDFAPCVPSRHADAQGTRAGSGQVGGDAHAGGGSGAAAGARVSPSATRESAAAAAAPAPAAVHNARPA